MKKNLKPSVEKKKEVLKITKKYVGAIKPTIDNEEKPIFIHVPEIIISESFI